MKTLTETRENGADLKSPIKLWLVDDNVRFRNLVSELLADIQGIQCVRQFSSPTELLSTLASKIGPDVILLDVQMGDENGVDAVRPIKSLARSTRVLMFTTCFDSQLRDRALSEGASGYLIKGGPLDKLVNCILQPDDPATLCSARQRRPTRKAATEATLPVNGQSSINSITRGINFLRSIWN